MPYESTGRTRKTSGRCPQKRGPENQTAGNQDGR